MANSGLQLACVTLSVLVAACWLTGGVAQGGLSGEFEGGNSTTPNGTTPSANVTTTPANMTTPSNVTTSPINTTTANFTTTPANITTTPNVTSPSNTTVTSPMTTPVPQPAPTASPFSVGSFFGGIALGVVVAVGSFFLVKWIINRKKGVPYRTV